MEKIIIFFKNLIDKFYIKLIEILLEAEGKKCQKKLEKDLEELNFFSDLNFFTKSFNNFGLYLFLNYCHLLAFCLNNDDIKSILNKKPLNRSFLSFFIPKIEKHLIFNE